jgi:hypothetical protein
VEFNEAWAKEGAKPPDHETAAAAAVGGAAGAEPEPAAEAVAALADP